MTYAVVLVVAAIMLIAFLWDMWIPQATAGRRRPGALGLLLSFSCVATAVVLSVWRLPGHLVVIALGLGLLSGVHPAQVVFAHARRARAQARQEAMRRRQRTLALPESLVDADKALKDRYDDVKRRFRATADPGADEQLLEEARQLASAMKDAACVLGSSRAHETSNDIPVLLYWAAQLSRKSYPPGHAQHLVHESDLRYYGNFASTAWLWERYRTNQDD